jgi:hypothetical protein
MKVDEDWSADEAELEEGEDALPVGAGLEAD